MLPEHPLCLLAAVCLVHLLTQFLKVAPPPPATPLYIDLGQREAQVNHELLSITPSGVGFLLPFSSPLQPQLLPIKFNKTYRHCVKGHRRAPIQLPISTCTSQTPPTHPPSRLSLFSYQLNPHALHAALTYPCPSSHSFNHTATQIARFAQLCLQHPCLCRS